jgi:hypothetical protein
MKKIVLALSLSLATFATLHAQPVMTSAALSPNPGDVFYGRFCDTTGITPGASGSSVVWNFSGLTTTGGDTLAYDSCAATPYCDSFPGSNIVSYNDGDFLYSIKSTSGITAIGVGNSIFRMHIAGGKDVAYFPLTYLSNHTDTAYIAIDGFSYQHHHDSMSYDGYGTLTLPTGTYTNVIRVHQTSVVTDSSFGFPTWEVSTTQTETYNWFDSGFHNPLLTITLDSANGNTVEYFVHGGPLSNMSIVTANAALNVYPNPAVNAVTVSFELNDASGAAITVSDLTGRTVATITGNTLKPGHNNITIPVSDLSAGMYIVRLQSAEGTVTRKVMVSK